jgi:TetR/AcrR family transcriptional repressor of nem operon
MVSTRGRALTSRGLATRARIVAAAADVIHQQGVGDTSIVDVQRASGTSGSQIYHYFADKESLVRAVAEYRAAEALKYQDSFGPLDSIAALRRWANAQVTFANTRLCAGGCDLGALVSQLAESDPVSRDTIAEGLGAWAQRIERGLKTMQERGTLDASTDTHGHALALLAALEGGLVLSQAQRDSAALASVLHAVVSHIETYSTETA